MAEIFISYKSERRKAAAHLAKILERYGYPVWFDYHLVKGDDFADEIDRRIREAKALVVLWCKLSVQSVWVRREAALGAKLKKLVPAKIEPCELRVDFDSDDYTDLSDWNGAPLDHKLYPLLDGIAHRVGRPPQLDFKAMREFEEDWRRYGTLSLRTFALEAPVKAGEEPRPVPPAPAVAHALTPAERDWLRFAIAESEDVEEIEAYIKQYGAGEPLWAVKAKKRLAVVNELLAKRAKAQRQELEARCRAEGRMQVAAAIARPAGLEWLLPGAGKAEGFKDADFAPEMVVVPAGEFWMGSKDCEGDVHEGPRHKVTIPKAFAVGRYALTFEEWDAAVAAGGVNHKPSDRGWGRGRRPVIDVNWEDAQPYIKWLSSKTGRPYRLLSEAEWEYCCRAGTETRYSFGDSESDLDRYAWYSANCGGETHPVGEKLPNEWGLHDMHGNVWEWCEDCWHDNYKGAPQDGSAWTTGDGGKRVVRGGSWALNPWFLRAAMRGRLGPDDRIRYRGVRLARTF